mmetsp:Transcript_29215/g.62922  ORF Transcript_29215/g.62922 Transcript_29215/m.62922 type:complete len:141 (-) Transcript_29215:119-541(-)
MQPGDILRRFRYSYYWGLVEVDTRHVCVDVQAGCYDGDDDTANNNENVGDDGVDVSTKQPKFRLEEFIDSPMSMLTTFYAVFGIFASIIAGYCSRVYFGGGNRGQLISSLLSVVLVVVVVVHFLLVLTGVQFPPLWKVKK